MQLLFQWFVATLSILVASYVVPGVTVTYTGAIIAAVVLGALNLFIRPIVTVITLPLNLLSFGLFTIVINAGFLLLVAYLVPGFAVATFWTALLLSIVLSAVQWVFRAWSVQ